MHILEWVISILATTIIFALIFPHLPKINKKFKGIQKEVEEMDIDDRW